MISARFERREGDTTTEGALDGVWSSEARGAEGRGQHGGAVMTDIGSSGEVVKEERARVGQQEDGCEESVAGSEERPEIAKRAAGMKAWAEAERAVILRGDATNTRQVGFWRAGRARNAAELALLLPVDWGVGCSFARGSREGLW